MAHTRQHRRQESRTRRRKNLLQIDKTNKNREIALKQKKLKKLDSRGKVTKGGGLKKQLANIPAAEHDAKVNRKARGLSNLPSDYKKQEQKFSKEADKSTPTENDTKAKSKKKSGSKTPAGFVRAKGGRLYSIRTAQGKKTLNKQKARKRAQEMAKKRLGK